MLASALETLSEWIKNKNIDLFVDQDHEPCALLEELSKLNFVKLIKFEKQSQYVLSFKQDRLVVLFENQKPILVDFLDPALKKYLGHMSKKNIFGKALALKHDPTQLIDLTAGFGKDSFVVSKFFSKVIWVERNPIVYFLLQDGLKRLLIEYPNLTDKFELVLSESSDFLKTLKDKNSNLIEKQSLQESVIYFDFMFTDKKSKSNKDMIFLKHITAFDNPINIEDYLVESTQAQPLRTVLKAKSYSGVLKPEQIYDGQQVKYFVFK